jgi:hypothetical protein
MELTLMAVKAARIRVFTVKKRPNIPCLIIGPPVRDPAISGLSGQSLQSAVDARDRVSSGSG